MRLYRRAEGVATMVRRTSADVPQTVRRREVWPMAIKKVVQMFIIGNYNLARKIKR